MLNSIENTKGENLGIPDDIINACREISDKAFEAADPTQYFPIDIIVPKNAYKIETLFEFHGEEEAKTEHEIDDIEGIKSDQLVTHICMGILNVCPIIQIKNKFYSIPLEAKHVSKKLKMVEILADISLFHILFEHKGSSDRTLIRYDDHRTKTGEHIVGNNCRIFMNGTYSIFDILSNFGKTVPKNDICQNLFEEINNLYFDELNSENLNYFIDLDLIGEDFGERILDRINAFIELYEGSSGKELFNAQVQNIFGQEKVTYFVDSYNNFLKTLHNIRSIFNGNTSALLSYTFYDKELAKNYIKRDGKNFFSGLYRYILSEIKIVLKIDKAPKYK